jgi:hypothetical protein
MKEKPKKAKKSDEEVETKMLLERNLLPNNLRRYKRRNRRRILMRMDTETLAELG